MARAIALRSDFSAADLRRLARHSRDAAQARRFLALAAIYDGGTRSEASRLGDVTLQIVRDWVVRFNAEGPAGLIDRKAPGPTPLLCSATIWVMRRIASPEMFPCYDLLPHLKCSPAVVTVGGRNEADQHGDA